MIRNVVVGFSHLAPEFSDLSAGLSPAHPGGAPLP